MRPLKNLPRRTWVLPEELNVNPDSGENVPIFSGMVGSSESPGMDVHWGFGESGAAEGFWEIPNS